MSQVSFENGRKEIIIGVESGGLTGFPDFATIMTNKMDQLIKRCQKENNASRPALSPLSSMWDCREGKG